MRARRDVGRIPPRASPRWVSRLPGLSCALSSPSSSRFSCVGTMSSRQSRSRCGAARGGRGCSCETPCALKSISQQTGAGRRLARWWRVANSFVRASSASSIPQVPIIHTLSRAVCSAGRGRRRQQELVSTQMILILTLPLLHLARGFRSRKPARNVLLRCSLVYYTIARDETRAHRTKVRYSSRFSF